ncbi:MAG: phosphatase PAP2 family protein [Acidimicrobiales bacterium]
MTTDASGSEPRVTPSSSPWLARLGADITALDEAVDTAVTNTPTPTLDGPMTWISNAATFGKLWFVIAALLSVVGGPRGRRTAARSLLAYGATSLTADAVLKMLMPRRRPGRENVESARDIRVPTSSSFPSGHAASAFAFAAAASTESPLLALPLFGVASLIGYSRVHAGVHYPSDVLAGAVVGLTIGTAVREATLRVGPLKQPRRV